MHAFHFGNSQKRLFGVYHAPEASRRVPAGVVICAPFGHEYIRAHRALRNLAARLSGAGLHVLRFDYFGTGDSAGSGEEATLAQWTSDVAAAIDELKDMSDLPRVSLVGVRLGAALAAVSTAARTDVDSLVLWDPIVRGGDYVRESLHLQARWLSTRVWMKVPATWPDSAELIGFPLTASLRAEIEGIDVRTLDSRAREIVVATSRGVEAGALVSALQQRGTRVRTAQVASDCDWQTASAVHLTLLANDMNEEIARTFADGAAA